MSLVLFSSAALALVSTGAIFGFFYAWICSTMWGLDTADPQVAIAAMQAMNASVRNIVFAPAFFGTPVVLLVTALAARQARCHAAAWAFAMAGVFYLFGAVAVTAIVNVPLNEALGGIRLPLDPVEANAIWSRYSAPWQKWNAVRTSAAGPSLLPTGYGIFRLGRDHWDKGQ